MAGKNTLSEAADLIRPAVENEYELYDIEFVKEGADWYLRIYIDKPGGVSIDDCEKVSRIVENLLDERDPISHAYILEVSSPGIDRKLKKDEDFARYAGKTVDVRLYKGLDGKKIYSGELAGLEDGAVVIKEPDGRLRSFPRQEVALCKLNIQSACANAQSEENNG